MELKTVKNKYIDSGLDGKAEGGGKGGGDSRWAWGGFSSRSTFIYISMIPKPSTRKTDYKSLIMLQIQLILDRFVIQRAINLNTLRMCSWASPRPQQQQCHPSRYRVTPHSTPRRTWSSRNLILKDSVFIWYLYLNLIKIKRAVVDLMAKRAATAQAGASIYPPLIADSVRPPPP